MYQESLKDIEKEVRAKYQPEIDAREKAHKQIWHQIRHKRAYIADVKTIQASKWEKDLQISSTNRDIKVLQEQHKKAKSDFDAWLAELEVKISAEAEVLFKERTS